MTKRWTSRVGRRAAIVLGAVVLVAMIPTGSAYAGTSCDPLFGCSESYNASSFTVLARHDWTCNWGSTGSSSTGCVGGASLLLRTWEGTPTNQDRDVVQIDAGWCYTMHFNNWYGKDWTVTHNRIGSSTPLYVQVEDGSIADVLAQGNNSCP